MSEAPAEPAAPAQEPQPSDESTADTPPTVEELQAQLEESKRESRKWEQRSKDNKTKADEFDKQRQAAMTDAERAVEEARQSAQAESARELALSRFDAAAARRNPGFDTTQALEYVDLGKFLGEDGKPDAEAIKAAVERLVPEPGNQPPSFDGGTRTPAPAQSGMTGLIRKAAGRA